MRTDKSTCPTVKGHKNASWAPDCIPEGRTKKVRKSPFLFPCRLLKDKERSSWFHRKEVPTNTQHVLLGTLRLYQGRDKKRVGKRHSQGRFQNILKYF